MHHTLNRCVRPVAVALAALLALATVAPPALGAQPARPAEATPAQASLSASAAAHVAALDAGALLAAQETAPTVDEPQSFLKSRKGVLAAVLFVAGVTFTFVSKSRDRVKSPIRD